MCYNLGEKLQLYAQDGCTGNVSELTVMNIGLTAVSSTRDNTFVQRLWDSQCASGIETWSALRLFLFCSFSIIAVFLIFATKYSSERVGALVLGQSCLDHMPHNFGLNASFRAHTKQFPLTFCLSSFRRCQWWPPPSLSPSFCWFSCWLSPPLARRGTAKATGRCWGEYQAMSRMGQEITLSMGTASG